MKHSGVIRLAVGLLLLSVRGIMSGDNVGVAGRVVDERSEALEGAYVGLLALPDSTYVGSVITDENGQFFIPTSIQGQCLLTTRLFGYNDNFITLNLPVSSALEIHLQPSSEELREVVVEGRAPKLTHEAGKFTFTPGALRDFAANSLDLITLVPMVGGGKDGLSILGKGKAIIYINGQDPHIPAEGILSELKNYPPSSIKRIEVITDPGASIGGNQGIINIILEYPYEGLIGSVSAYGSISNGLLSGNPSIWLGYRHRRLSFSTNLIYFRSDNSSSNEFRYDYTAEPLIITNRSESKGYSNVVRGYFTLGYELNKRSDIGLTAIVNAGEEKSHLSTSTLEVRDGVPRQTYYRAYGKQPFDIPTLSAIGYYRLTTDSKGSKLEISADYSYSPDKSSFSEDFNGRVRNENRSTFYNSFSGKAEYRQRFNEKMELTGGYEIGGNNSDRRRNGLDIADNYHYRKLVNTFYVQFNGRLGKKVSLRAGLRLENMYDMGRQQSEDISFSHNYTYLEPSLSFSYELPRSQSLSLELKKYYSRPYSYMYNPYVNWNSDNSYSTGNPDLKPYQSFICRIYYSLPSGLIFNVNYDHTWDMQGYVNLPVEDGITVNKPINIGTINTLSLNAQYNKIVTSFWNLRLYGSARYNNLHSQIQDYDMGYSRWTGSLSISNIFIVPGGWYGSAMFNVVTPSSEKVAKIPWQYGLSFSVDKNFKFGLEARVGISIPFGSQRGARYYETSEYRYSQHVLDQKYYLNFSLNYTFGKRTVQAAQKRELLNKN